MANAPIAVITGASRGIGRATAEHFLRQGYHVWALARSLEPLQALAREHGDRVTPLQIDVREAGAITSACRTILQIGTPRVVVNNAGVSQSGPLRTLELEDFRRVMSINVEAPFLFCRELLPAMAAAGVGRVINVASIAGLRGLKYSPAYTASKHALVGLTRSLALEFAHKQITVNAVCPGWTETDMVEGAARAISSATGRTPEEARQVLAGMHPSGRLVGVNEVAALCLFLASDEAASITGAALSVDGGATV